MNIHFYTQMTALKIKISPNGLSVCISNLECPENQVYANVIYGMISLGIPENCIVGYWPTLLKMVTQILSLKIYMTKDRPSGTLSKWPNSVELLVLAFHFQLQLCFRMEWHHHLVSQNMSGYLVVAFHYQSLSTLEEVVGKLNATTNYPGPV